MAKTTDLVVAGEQSAYAVLALGTDEVTELIRENLSPGEGLTPRDLIRVKVPAGGGQSWEIPTLEGEVSMKELTGILLRRDTRRAYWPDEYTGSDDPPECYSDDGVQGVGEPGVQCSSCPYNEFESARNGIGKACKETRQFFLLPEDGILPYVVTIPPASLTNAKAYGLKLLNARLRPHQVVTKLTLEKAENAGGIKYSRVLLAAGDRLDVEAAARMKDYAALLAPMMERAARVEHSEVGEES